MLTNRFLKLFPPPKYLAMPYAGLDISDDAITFIEYKNSIHGRTISKYDRKALKSGILIGGDIHDEAALLAELKDFVQKNSLHRVRVSLPEEKIYLFHTDVPNAEAKAISQNIEFKIEENVPLSAKDALFYYDLIASSVGSRNLRASVSVVSRVYVEKMLSVLNSAGLEVASFEMVPRAIVNASLDLKENVTSLIVYGMNSKVGLYITFGNMIYFTSTISVGENDIDLKQNLPVEISKILTYWSRREDVPAKISHIIISGHNAEVIIDMLGDVVNEEMPPRILADAWRNAFNINKYIPPISKDESLEYIVASGLALQ